MGPSIRAVDWAGAGGPETRRIGTDTAVRTPKGHRWLAVSGLVICPAISGIFFGLVAALLVLRGGSGVHASEIGAIVGGAMFASNALALCIVLEPRVTAPAETSSAAPRGTEAHAS